MNILIIGNGQMALSCIEIMLNYEQTKICAIVTDPKDGGIEKIQEYCNKDGIPLYNIEELSSSKLINELKGFNLDYIFNINSRQLFSIEVINIPLKGVINFHNSYLPKYRGINVCSWAIINQEKEYGVTWHLIDPKKIDSGDILMQMKFELDEKETAFTLILKCVQFGIDLFKELFPKLVDDSIQLIPQNLSEGSFYLRKKTPNNGEINFNLDFLKIESFVRALNFGLLKNDFVPALFFINNHRVTVLKVTKNNEDFNGFEPGEIVSINESNIVVACSDSLFSISKIQLDGVSVKIQALVDKTNLKKGDNLTQLKLISN